MRYVLLLIALVGTAGGAQAASPIEGNWRNPGGSVTVHIGACRRGSQSLCGRVIAASAEAREAAAAAGTEPLVGTELMSGLDPVGDGAWRGDIFVPDRNIHAVGELHLTGPRTIEVQGCAMGGLICKTQVWTRMASAPDRSRRRAGR